MAEESKRAETLRNEVRLAELRAEEARRRDADEAKKNEVQSEARESTDAQLGQTSHKKYCSICGDELRPGARFCRKCGNRVEMLEAKGIDR